MPLATDLDDEIGKLQLRLEELKAKRVETRNALSAAIAQRPNSLGPNWVPVYEIVAGGVVVVTAWIDSNKHGTTPTIS